MKKIILILGLILFASFVHADIIADYSMPSTVPLDDYIAVSGTFIDDLNLNSNSQCDLYLSKDGIEIYRFTSQNTDLRGHFFFRSELPTNVFTIGEDYNVTAVCGTGTATNQITITQRRTPYEEIASWWLWITNPETIFLPLLIGGLVFFIALVIYLIYKAMREGKVRF